MMQNSQTRKTIEPKRNAHVFSKRILTEISVNSQRPRSKRSLSEITTSRSLTSCLSKDLPSYPRKSTNLSTRRALSVLSPPQICKNNKVPAKALEINNLIDKKNKALKLKYKVKDVSDPIPDLLEIKQSVKKEELSFMRRMDKQLNTTGNAFLLTHLRQDLHIQYHNYLKEALQKNRKNRKYLVDIHKNQNTEKFVIFQCQLPKEKAVTA